VFAAELVAQAENRENVAPRLTISRSDFERLPANVFDEMRLADILRFAEDMELFAVATFATDSTHRSSSLQGYALTTTANADFMEVLSHEQIGNTQLYIPNVNTTIDSSISPTATTASTLMSGTTVPKHPRSPQGASSPPFASAKRQSSKSTPK
jgi:hypothetical protein